MAGHWVGGFGVIFLICAGCSGESTRDRKAPSRPLEPGTCVNTDCTWPVVQPFQAGPEVSCTPTEGAPIGVEWSATARKVDCGGSECVAAPFDVAVSSSGEVWTSSQLLPSPPPNIEEATLGFEIQRMDSLGSLELEQATHGEPPLNQPTLDAVGLSVTPDGGLEWVGPSPETSGLSLLHFDRLGSLVSAKWLVEHASQSEAHFGPQGITVAYRYVSAVDASEEPPKPTEQVGVARFDAKGDLRWNQAAFATVNVPLDHIDLLGVDSAGVVYALVQRESSFEAEAGSLVVRLSQNGTIDWVREMDAATWMGATYPTSDGFVLVGSGGDSGLRIDRVDGLGNGQWRRRLSDPMVDGLAISAEERLFLRGSSEEAFLLSSDATSCTRHAFDLYTYLPVSNGFHESYSKSPAFARLPSERLAFAYSGRSGVLALP